MFHDEGISQDPDCHDAPLTRTTFQNFKNGYVGMRRQGMVEDSYSSMIRLLAVNLASDGIFDGIIREKVDSMRETDPDLVRKALDGITVLKELKRV